MTQMSISLWMDKYEGYIHTVDYYSAIERNKVLITCYNMDEPGKHVKGKKSVTKDHIFYDSTSGDYPGRKQISGCQGLGVGGNWGVTA